MANIIYWKREQGDLQEVTIHKTYKTMRSSIDGSNHSYLLDCLESAETAGEVFSDQLCLAIKNGFEYIDLSEKATMHKLWESSFDCVTELFNRPDWAEIIKVLS